jgi:signal transduction histidine kinase
VATTGAAYLPSLYESPLQQAPFAKNVNVFLTALNVAALILLFVRRRTVLDQWLIVTLVAWLPNFTAAVMFTVVRFTVAWYLSRVYALIAGSSLLLALLTETVWLYSQLANTILLLRRERSDRLVSVDAATAAMAHEIRQPLTGITMQGSAALNWLKATPPNLQKVQACVESALASAHRMDEIISSARELFRKAVHHRTIVDVNDAARQVVDLIQHDLRANRISVVTEYKDDLPQVHADRTLLQMAILNLLKNAIEAMGSVQPDDRRLRLATSLNGNSFISLSIEDSGPGIAVKDRDHVFDALYTTKTAGTGLGLSICRTIVEDHGGKVRLTKTDSRGSAFEIALPLDSHDNAPVP